jgi:hypothetical protein
MLKLLVFTERVVAIKLTRLGPLATSTTKSAEDRIERELQEVATLENVITSYLYFSVQWL